MHRMGALRACVPGAEVVQHVDRRARGDAAAIGLGERAEDAGHDAKARIGAHAERRREARLQDAPLARHPLVEVPEQPLVDVELGIERLQIPAEGDAQEPGIGHEVDRPARLVVGARPVEAHVIPDAVEGELDPVRARLGPAVAVEVVVKRPRALGHELEEQLARPRPRLGDALVERREHGRGPVAREQLAEARLGQVARRHHGARVPFDEAGQARVAQEDPVRLLVELPLAHDADGRDEHALVVDLRRVRRDAPRPQSADVLVVPEGDGERDGLSLVEDGHGEDHVLMVLDGAVGDVRVVEPVHVARPHGVERIRPEDRIQHPRAAARDVAGDDAPPGVEHADEVVLLLLDERRHRAPLHQELHVVNGRGEAAADDLERDGIDRPHRARPGGHRGIRHGRAPGGCCGRDRRGPGSRA